MYLCVCVYTVYGLGLGLGLVIYIHIYIKHIYITGVYKINYIFAIIYNDWKQCIPIGQAGLQIFLGGGERRGGCLDSSPIWPIISLLLTASLKFAGWPDGGGAATRSNAAVAIVLHWFWVSLPSHPLPSAPLPPPGASKALCQCQCCSNHQQMGGHVPAT